MGDALLVVQENITQMMPDGLGRRSLQGISPGGSQIRYIFVTFLLRWWDYNGEAG